MTTTGKYNGWISAGLYNGLQKLSVPIFGVISTMILARRFSDGATDMGIWGIFLSLVGLVELVRQALVKTSLIRYVNHSTEEDHKYVLSAALFLNTLITIILAVPLVIFAAPIAHKLNAPGLDSMIYVFSTGMIGLIPFSHFEWIMYGKSHFKGLFYTYLFRQGLSLLLIVLYVIFKSTISLNVLVIIYSAGIFAGAIAGYFCVKKFLSRKFILSKIWLSKLWHFGKFVLGSGISTQVFGSAGQMMTSSMLGPAIGPAMSGLNSIASRVINLADIPSQVLGDILFPKSSKKENAENKGLIKYYYEKTVGATLCVILPMILFIVCFPKFIILILAGKKFLQAVPFLQFIAITGMFLAFLKQFGIIIDSTGRPGLNFLTITFIAVIHVGFTYVMIHNFGFIGAAYALICSHVIGFIVTQIILYKYFGIQFLNCFKYAFKFYPEMSKLLFEKVQLKWKTR
ncbi:MAG: oligosaccharide flippase family protein [Ferruginibacter sp.]